MPDLDLGGWTIYRDETDPLYVQMELYVRNIGAGDANGFSVEAICSGLLSSETVPWLYAGQTTTITLTFPLFGSGPAAPQVVTLDPADTVLESDETNNVSPMDDPECQV